jgi:hypothetical protein
VCDEVDQSTLAKQHLTSTEDVLADFFSTNSPKSRATIGQCAQLPLWRGSLDKPPVQAAVVPHHVAASGQQHLQLQFSFKWPLVESEAKQPIVP